MQGHFRSKITQNYSGFIYGYPDEPDEYPINVTNVVGRLKDPEVYLNLIFTMTI